MMIYKDTCEVVTAFVSGRVLIDGKCKSYEL